MLNATTPKKKTDVEIGPDCEPLRAATRTVSRSYWRCRGSEHSIPAHSDPKDVELKCLTTGKTELELVSVGEGSRVDAGTQLVLGRCGALL